MVNFGTRLPAGSKAQLGIRFGGKLTGSLLGVCQFFQMETHLLTVKILVLLQHLQS